MRNSILTLALFAVPAMSAPAPYPVTINSRAQTAPPLTVYRAAESLFRVSFVDGDTASDITGTTAFMSFATNASAAVVSTASVSVVEGMTGVVDCVFSPAAVNVAAGRYMYEVGVTPIGGTARIYRQGVFTVAASPYAGSAAAVTWATNMNWGTINWTGLPDWLLVSETAGWETGSHAGFVTNSADFYPVSNPSNYITIADVPAQTSQLYVASAGTVTGPQSNLIATALQSEADPVALAAIAALSNNVSALSSRVTATNALFSAWFAGLQSRTSYWDTAYSWGDWHSAVAQKLDITSTNGWETGSHAAFLTSAPPQSVVSVNGMTGAVVVTEQDLAALRLYHYGSPYIIESPAEWFVFDGAGTITGVNTESVTNWNIVIPWEIGGVPVTEIGFQAFSPDQFGTVITSFIGGNNITSIGNYAFYDCAALASLTAPNLTSIGNYAFFTCVNLASLTAPNLTSIGDMAFIDCVNLASLTAPNLTSIDNSAFHGCYSLTAVYFDGNAPTIGDAIFGGLPANQVTNYVTNPTATGWGATLGGMPVVRLPLHTDSLTLGGVTHTNWPSADVSGLATTQSVDAVAGDLASAKIILNNHTSNGTIGSDAHLQTGDRALIDSVPGLATTQSVAAVAQEIAAIEFPVASTNYTAWTGTVTPADGTATVAIAHGNQPVLVIDAPTVLQLDATGFGTSGVSRVSLSYYTGTNSLTFATNVISYAETPAVDTNGWNTLLIRRVSDGAWKGVGL